MGRGRAKAKQAKVARQLKYQTSGTSIEDLREELGAAPSPIVRPDDNEAEDTLSDPYDDADEDDPYDEPYDELAERYAHDAGDRPES